MTEERNERGGEEIRSPLQIFIRVLLALLVVAILTGLILALVLRPERVLEPDEAGVGQPGERLADAVGAHQPVHPQHVGFDPLKQLSEV